MVANSAFAVIKKTLENGREISSAGAAIAKFVGAEDKLQQDLHRKKNSIWTNSNQSSSVGVVANEPCMIKPIVESSFIVAPG